MSKIYILLPVHNRKEITRGFVASLKAQTFSDYHLVLIDDGSTDGTAEMVLEYIPSATVLRGEGNWWWAGSLQQGIHWLQRNHLHQNDIILMINDDVVLDNNFIEAGRKELLSLPGTLLQATSVMTFQGKYWMWGWCTTIANYSSGLPGRPKKSIV